MIRKMSGFFSILFFLFNFSAVVKAAEEVPLWIQEKIRQAEEKPGRVERYEIENRFYYIFTQPLEWKDGFSAIYDDTGKYICAPWGGVHGQGDQKCPELSEKLKESTIIWKDQEKNIKPNRPLEPFR